MRLAAIESSSKGLHELEEQRPGRAQDERPKT